MVKAILFSDLNLGMILRYFYPLYAPLNAELSDASGKAITQHDLSNINIIFEPGFIKLQLNSFG